MYVLRICEYACEWLRLTLELLFGGFVKLLEITHCFWLRDRDLAGSSWSGSPSVRRKSAGFGSRVRFARVGGQEGDGVPVPEDATGSQENILPEERTDYRTACRAHLT